jgi:rubrerythrin
MESATAIGRKSGTRETGNEPAKWRIAHEPDAPTTCCGRPMESRFVRARDRLGQTLFVAVWRCPVCGRVAL